MGWKVLDIGCTDTQKEVTPQKKNTFFVMEPYIEHAEQNEKDVPDLLEPIMRPTDHVKEELRKIFVQNDTI